MMEKEQSQSLEKDLYHRSPYLLLDEVVECTSDKITVKKYLKENEFFFEGHFPNAPILPGALMQEMTSQSAGVLIARYHNPMGENYDTNNFDPSRPALGVLSRIKDAKFKGFARPGDTLEIEIELRESLKDFMEFKGCIYKVTDGQRELIMTNLFCLTNVPSEYLLSH